MGAIKYKCPIVLDPTYILLGMEIRLWESFVPTFKCVDTLNANGTELQCSVCRT